MFNKLPRKSSFLVHHYTSNAYVRYDSAARRTKFTPFGLTAHEEQLHTAATTNPAPCIITGPKKNLNEFRRHIYDSRVQVNKKKKYARFRNEK